MTKKFLMGGVALLAIGGIASAADLRVLPNKAPYINQAASPFSWSGFYLGVDGGYGFAAQDIGLSKTFLDSVQEAGTIGSNANGAVGGVHGGFNYQISPNWVFGVEGRFAATGLKSDATLDTNGNSMRTSLPWEGSVVGRLGFVPLDPHLMIYGLGGAAFGEIKQSLDGPNISGGNISASNVHTGWTAGAGIEYAFTNNLIGGVEYRYTNLGGHGFALCDVKGCDVGTFNASTTAAWNEVLARLSVKF